jgi:hypothetical protein
MPNTGEVNKLCAPAANQAPHSVLARTFLVIDRASGKTIANENEGHLQRKVPPHPESRRHFFVSYVVFLRRPCGVY